MKKNTHSIFMHSTTLVVYFLQVESSFWHSPNSNSLGLHASCVFTLFFQFFFFYPEFLQQHYCCINISICIRHWIHWSEALVKYTHQTHLIWAPVAMIMLLMAPLLPPILSTSYPECIFLSFLEFWVLLGLFCCLFFYFVLWF